MTTEQQQPSVNSLDIVRLAADGDVHARKIINEIAHPMITYQTSQFCKRFCHNSKFHYVCTLEKPWGSPPSKAAFCEWGNASYAWMLDDLTRPGRLIKFEARNNSRINDYLFRIANSLPFYERWKEWRFGKRLHIPTYIQELNKDAGSVFTGLFQQFSLEEISQKHQISLEHVTSLADKIIIILTQRNRLHLLNPPKTISLTGLNNSDDEDIRNYNSEADIAIDDTSLENLETSEQLQTAWNTLTAVEQFVIEEMIIDDMDADHVLSALKKLNLQITDGVPADKTNRQQLYYFRRKVLTKLAKLVHIEDVR